MSQSEQQHKALVTEVFMVSLAGGAAGDYSTAALDIRGRSCTEDKGTKISSIGERVCLCVYAASVICRSVSNRWEEEKPSPSAALRLLTGSVPICCALPLAALHPRCTALGL